MEIVVLNVVGFLNIDDGTLQEYESDKQQIDSQK